MNKYIVMTSIFRPSEAVRAFACMDGWQLIVVGDRKTPADWQHENVVFLSAQEQLRLGYPLLDNLGWNHYARKMLGYLYAMERGAELIADVDDDNIPLPGWERVPAQASLEVITEPGFVNIYRYFTDEFIWPRGYPIDELHKPVPAPAPKRQVRVGVWQFLANSDPDVDAIYRMLFNKPVEFFAREPIALAPDVFCPFNSQNTFVLHEAFPVLYLPFFVTFRFTDILRGIIAQPLLWAAGLRLAFGPATAVQERNPHNYLRDFESEIPAYLQTGKAAAIAAEAAVPSRSMQENLRCVYQNLADQKIVPAAEVELCSAWIASLNQALGRRPS